jgi:uncharacterized membrane protein YdfJ with MMPL/SSD domain
MTLLLKARRHPPSTPRPASRMNLAYRRVVATIFSPNVLMIVAFVLIGLLLTLNLMFRYPELGAVIEQYNQF